jgi:hypothetical protein
MPVVAVDRAGNAVALWRRIEDGLHSRIQESFRTAGGDWGPVKQLTAADEFAAYPRLAVDASGEFVATWENGLAGSVVDVARAPAGGQFGPSKPVSGPRRRGVQPRGQCPRGRRGHLGRGASARPAHQLRAGDDRPRRRELRAPAEPVSGERQRRRPRSRRRARWPRNCRVDAAPGIALGGTTQAASNDGPGSAFGDPQVVSAVGPDAEQPNAAVDGSGSVTAAWAQSPTPSDLLNEIVTSVRPASAGGCTGRQLVGTGDEVLDPSVAAAQDGSAILAWENDVGEVDAAVRGATQSAFGPPQALADQDSPGRMQVVMDGQGNGFVTWFTNTAVWRATTPPARC